MTAVPQNSEGTTVQPPGETAQKINSLLHVEPYSYIFHSLFWGFVFIVACPLVGIYLILRSGFRLIRSKALMMEDCDSKVINAKTCGKELAIYITGCDTGFGKDLAFALAEKGFFVFSACLTQKGMKQYEGATNPKCFIDLILSLNSYA